MKLENCAEIIGILHDIEISDNSLKLIFLLDNKIELPISSFDISKLKKFLGRRIGILNIDGEILIREIKKGAKNE
jgi:hypothetical protein